MPNIVLASLATLPGYIADLFMAKHHSFIGHTVFDINNKTSMKSCSLLEVDMITFLALFSPWPIFCLIMSSLQNSDLN